MEFGKRALLSLLFCIATLASLAQNVAIEGVVYDKSTLEPLPGVIVVCGDQHASTNLDGLFTMGRPAGDQEFTFQLTGYKKLVQTFNLHPVGDATYKLVAYLEPDKHEFNVVVVSAGKFEQSIGEVTVSMEVIQAPLIQNRNTVQISEMLQQTPGVSIVDDEPQIRAGSGYSFGAGSRVAVLMDDLPVLSGDAGKPSWGFLPVENVSQVEVIKGASSVLYGSSALSGVVNFRTSFPADTPLTRIIAYHGVYSAPQTDSAKYWSYTPMRSGVQFLHSRKIGQWDMVFGGNLYSDDGALGPVIDSIGTYKDEYDPFDADRYDATVSGRMNMNLRYRFKKVEGLSAGVNTNWRRSNGLATLLWNNTSDGLFSAYDGSSTRTLQWLGTVDPFVTYYTAGGSKHSLRTRWQSLDNENDNDQGNFSDVYYGEYQYQKQFDEEKVKDLTLTGGLVGIFTDARGELFTGGNANGSNTARNYAGYLQVDKKFRKKLNVSAGVRYEYFQINEEETAKPVFRAGLSYQVHKATFLRGSFGQGFRFPSIAEKFIVTSVGSLYIYANPDLVAETSYNAELGIKQGFKIGNVVGYLDLAAFQQEFDNFIEFTFGQWATPTLQNLLGFGFKSVNTGRARVRGGEISAMGQGKIGPVKLQFLAGYTYTDPVSLEPNYVYARNTGDNSPVTYATTSADTTGNILKYRMRHLVRADVQATYRNWEAGVSFRSNSHMTNIDNAFQEMENNFPAVFNPQINRWREDHKKGDYVIDARLSCGITPQSRLALIVNNVLNREYAIRPLAIESTRVTMLQYTLQF